MRESAAWRTVAIDGIDPLATLRPLAFLSGDPTIRLRPGLLQRATTTPAGPGLVEVRWVGVGSTPGEVQMRHAGPGGQWLADRAPQLLGCTDSLDEFDSISAPVRALWHRHPGLRLTRTGTLWHDLACLIVQQRINGRDASHQWRRLVSGLGTPLHLPMAQGEGEAATARRASAAAAPLIAPPEPQLVAGLGYADLHPFGIERVRAQTLIRAAREVLRVQDRVDGEPEDALPALRLVSGIGPWTLTSLAALTWAASDTVVVGDYGLPGRVTYALTGEREGDDARMIELLEPFRPHRLRVTRLLELAPGPPRRFPRGQLRDIRTQ